MGVTTVTVTSSVILSLFTRWTNMKIHKSPNGLCCMGVTTVTSSVIWRVSLYRWNEHENKYITKRSVLHGCYNCNIVSDFKGLSLPGKTQYGSANGLCCLGVTNCNNRSRILNPKGVSISGYHHLGWWAWWPNSKRILAYSTSRANGVPFSETMPRKFGENPT